MAGIETTVTGVADIERVRAALLAEAGGAKHVARLVRNLRAATEPVVAEIRAGARAIPAGTPHGGESLRAAVERSIGVQVRTTGALTGVRIIAKKTSVRGFKQTPKRVNSAKGWRHPVYGRRNTWVQQVGKPGFFDEPPKRHRAAFLAAAKLALDETAAEIAARG